MKPDERPEGQPRTSGVIVTYRPAPHDLLRLVQAVRPQVDLLFIIDNGDGRLIPTEVLQSDVSLICLGDNKGIGAAQNIGVSEALRQGSAFVLLLDQDSIPAGDMVARLIEAHERLVSRGTRVAAVGPSYIDPRQGDVAPFVYRDGFQLKRRQSKTAEAVAETDFLIASGCLVSREALSAVGLMEEALFIDYVDIEWGLRARDQGFLSFGVHAAVMTHSLGDEWLAFCGRRVPVHSPLRHYYQFRNAIWLARRPWINWPWRLILLQRLVLQFLFFSLFGQGRLQHVRKMGLGFWHGMTGRSGKLPE
ncbi:rhamnosyltransferase [Rhizobium sp. RU35A]|uniref:glycosyltransferase family 2 protein n=1 Tax=Rhizobium sp. RU35A TaxID=1907414 RepID=UPI00095671B2|nr:glycosyltransferase family 2 protein [Rhizobium sp. RU35A]SIQ10435.1 rhamnosyltransferase [Rhizobium sp. RU35A]